MRDHLENQTKRNPEPASEVPTSPICLVITYFEEGDGLRESLESVRLTPHDSIVIVDDGSERAPARRFLPESHGAVPIELVELPRNMGVAAAAKIGVAHAPPEASYIARLDCRDTCVPERFELQRAYLDTHPECGIVGSSVVFSDLDGNVLYSYHQPATDRAIRRRMRINCALTQPSVMFRRSVYDAVGGYSESFPYGEDYALFRAIMSVSEGKNFERPLVTCTTQDGGISQTHRRRQLITRIKVIATYWDWHPGSAYGVVRAVAQLMTSRNFTSRVRRATSKFRVEAS